MQTVVAMGYSVTVSAAALMMEKLYAALVAEKGSAGGDSVGASGSCMRKRIGGCILTKSWIWKIGCCRWCMPNGEAELRLEPLSGRARAEALTARARRYRLENDKAKPTYGFVGRDLEILKIEKALLRHNVLLLQGWAVRGRRRC